jgi:Sel1 repeat-containing protein
MRKVLLVALMFLLAASATAFADQRKTSADAAERQALEKLATQGDADAEYKLGVLYMKGEGGPQVDTEAAEWFGKAAEQGHVDAQLALMYSVGLGIQDDLTKAVKWYWEAAEQGEAEAQITFAMMYYNGLGVPQSEVFAYQWAKISISNLSLEPDDRTQVQELLDALTAELTPTEIAEAEKLVKQWQSRAGDRSQNTQ